MEDSSRADRETTAGSERSIASSELFQGRRDIVILHRDQVYRLRITRADKLILTK